MAPSAVAAPFSDATPSLPSTDSLKMSTNKEAAGPAPALGTVPVVDLYSGSADSLSTDSTDDQLRRQIVAGLQASQLVIPGKAGDPEDLKFSYRKTLPTTILYDEQGRVRGVATGNMGLGKDGEPTDHFQLGMELLGKYTIFAEGARGHLGKQLLAKYQLTEGKDTQTFAIGIKELWEIPADKAQPGKVVHTAGWPMEGDTFGGGFLYHLADNKVTLGFVIGLDYDNPYLSPFEEMQRWKAHPAIRAHIEGGKRIGYGARAINNGTPQALPKTVFPGGALIGCDAGYLNAARIKGSHAAIKSGMLCADALAEALAAGRASDELSAYPEAFEKSWLKEELDQQRNFKLWFKKGPTVGALMAGIEQHAGPTVIRDLAHPATR